MSETIRTKLRGVTQNDPALPAPRQEIIRKLVDPLSVMLLLRETQNLYDPNAIAASIYPVNENPWGQTEYRIGYLSKELAEQIAPLLDNGWVALADVLEKTGGIDGESYGVNIEITLLNPEEAERLKSKPVDLGNISQSSPVITEKKRRMTFWRAALGILLVAIYIGLLSEVNSVSDFLIYSVVTLGPAVFCLWPWISGLYQFGQPKLKGFIERQKSE